MTCAEGYSRNPDNLAECKITLVTIPTVTEIETPSLTFSITKIAKKKYRIYFSEIPVMIEPPFTLSKPDDWLKIKIRDYT